MKGSELRARREAIGLNQTQVSEFFGVDKATVLRWERSAELGRLVTWGYAKLIYGDAEFDTWFNALKPAARRGILRRAGEIKSDSTLNGVERGPAAGAEPAEATPPARITQILQAGQAGVTATRIESETSLRQLVGEPAPESVFPEHEDIAAGPEVEELRRVLKAKLRTYGKAGLRDLAGRTGIEGYKLEQFAFGLGGLGDEDLAKLLEVQRESEGE
jgi:hypothetical protein